MEPIQNGMMQRKWLLLITPALLAIVILLPRLLSPQFGLLDDGITLRTVRQMADGNWEMWDAQVAGRFRPGYWVYWLLLYVMGGANPLWFFIANAILLAGLTSGLVLLVRALGGSYLQAWLAGIIFTLSGPVIENFYTLSKGEPLQLFWIVVSLLLLTSSKRIQKSWVKTTLVLLTALTILFAIISKETSLVMVPISFFWLVLGWIHRRKSEALVDLRYRGVYFLITMIGAVVFFLLRSSLAGTGQLSEGYISVYKDFDLGNLLADSLRWLGWLVQSTPYFFPLLGLLVIWLIFKKEVPEKLLVWDLLVWMGGWVGILIPWIFSQGYYLLPFTAGASIFCGIVVGQTIQDFRIRKRVLNTLGGIAILTAGVLFLGSLPNNVTDAKLQLAVDAANEEVLSYLAETLPPESRMYVNIQDPNEYVVEIGIHLAEIHQRPDITVDFVRYQDMDAGGGQDRFSVLSPFIENQLRLTVRMGVYEPTMDIWNEGLQEYLEGVGAELAYRNERQFRLSAINFPQLLCPIFPNRGYCRAKKPFFDNQKLSYGWSVYSIGTP